MEDRYLFLANEINLSNIAAFSREQTGLEEQRICDLAEIAKQAAHFSKKLLLEGMSLYEVLYLLAESLDFSSEVDNDSSFAENDGRLNKFCRTVSALDKSVFCGLLLEYFSYFDVSVSEEMFLAKKPSDELFTYVKNMYADEAYDVFTQDFSDPKLAYSGSFKEALKRVTDNLFSYCLLPIEERGARIPSVDELIFRGDYKINAVVPVFGYDGSADLKYALVSKNLYYTASQSDDDRYFEFKIPADSDINISELMLCTEELGCSIYRINTQVFDTEDGQKTYFSVVLKEIGEDFSKLFIYLTLFAPEHIPVGIYKNLE